ncbi:helix-turn-helix domain-containing protein [uncultured Pseudokineococcus sp.]|uniref:helix-turn-helix domain-containing protein n=1 Tax=uncultured Pseudokineococcus sp. TaxID=1642928 RepID=UPI00261293FD|nr:helix-turn-helix domain-containing protein [uncultured Pseudokineococcus sp.]
MSRLDEAFADLPDRLSVEQLAKVLGIDVQTAYGWLQKGRVPGYKIGRSWVILRDEIRDFLAANSNQRQPETDGPS